MDTSALEAETTGLLNQAAPEDIKSVEPDLVVIDGHAFTLTGANQPQAHIDYLDSQVDNATVTFATIPKELKAWEVPLKDS